MTDWDEPAMDETSAVSQHPTPAKAVSHHPTPAKPGLDTGAPEMHKKVNRWMLTTDMVLIILAVLLSCGVGAVAMAVNKDMDMNEMKHWFQNALNKIINNENPF